MSNRIFISYRREDRAGSAGRIYDQLAAHFGPDSIFMDVDDIDPGVDFVESIENAISQTNVLVVIIGPAWLDVADSEGNRRLENPEDFVRIEVSAALKRNIRVIPVLIDRAQMPRSTDLPDDLKPLARRNAIKINHSSFRSDAQRLIGGLERAINQAEVQKRINTKNETIRLEKKVSSKSIAPQSIPKTYTNSIGMKFVYIHPGTFTMGSPESEQGRCSNEQQHQVTLTQRFFIQTTPVTQAQYKQVMDKNPSHFKGIFKRKDRPVESVSWFDAVTFCNVLSQQTGLDEAYEITTRQVKHRPESNGYRLPTEAEWEYACRAGTKGDRYGNIDEIAWYDKNSGNETQGVEQKKANDFGLYDMLGNVWEWCYDRYGAYPKKPVTDPTGTENGSGRVIRGGSWLRNVWLARSANRNNFAPDYRNHALGFRLVLPVGQ